MSVLCQKALSINVPAPCAFIQDNANDSILINGGFAYSSQRQEVLAVSGSIAALYPITALGRAGGTKVVMPAVGRGVAWCPSVSKYYITLNGSTVRSYDPVTFTFGPAIAVAGNCNYIVYAAVTDRLYTITSGRFIIEIIYN